MKRVISKRSFITRSSQPATFAHLHAALRRQLLWADDYRSVGDLAEAMRALHDADAIEHELRETRPQEQQAPPPHARQAAPPPALRTPRRHEPAESRPNAQRERVLASLLRRPDAQSGRPR